MPQLSAISRDRKSKPELARPCHLDSSQHDEVFLFDLLFFVGCFLHEPRQRMPLGPLGQHDATSSGASSSPAAYSPLRVASRKVEA